MSKTMQKNNVKKAIKTMQENVAKAEEVVARREQLEKQRIAIENEIKDCTDTVQVLLSGQRVKPKVGRPKGQVGRPKKKDGRGRPKNAKTKNKLTLEKAIKQVLQKSENPMQVKDIARAVLNIGYKTKNDNFTYFSSSVAKICRESDDINYVARGVFQMPSTE